VSEYNNLNRSPQDTSTDFVYHFMQVQNFRQPSSGHVIGRGISVPHLIQVVPMKDM
jgi:hypothetical protein